MDYLDHDGSGVKPLGLVFLICMVVLTWKLPRRSAVFPLLITTCYMPLGQMFVIGGLHFQFFRVVLLTGCLRVMSRNERNDWKINYFDKVFIWWVVATLVLGTLAEFTMDRFINRAGEVINALGAYFLIRCWMRKFDDAVHVVRFLAVMIVPLAISMLVEKITMRNIFAVFGGVPEFTGVREGKLRCQGAFRHPILAGTYGVTAFPLFVGLWCLDPRARKRALIGALCTIVVTVAASSSGALLALMSEILGLMLWRTRQHMQLIRRSVVVVLVLLAMTMKAPVWYLFARLSEIAGGTGWYRSYLIDQAVVHFNEWWLVGSTYTAHWAPAGELTVGSPNNMDIVNHYVAEGLGGGIVKLGLFVTMIVIGYKTVGRWTRVVGELLVSQKFFVWSLGVCLFGHCVSFMSVSYFDQIIVMWYWLLAVMSLLIAQYPTILQTNPATVQGGRVVNLGGPGSAGLSPS